MPPSPGPEQARSSRKANYGAVIASSVFTTIAVIVALGLIGSGLSSGSDDNSAADPEISLENFLPTTVPTTTTVVDPAVYNAEELVATFGNAVWRVESIGCDEVWTGTAFAIDAHHLVTNHHVVANNTRPFLQSRDGRRWIEGTVIGWSERPDVAVIEVEDPLEQWLQWAPTEELREGQSILALGYPVPDTVFTATPGSIMSFQARAGKREALRTNAALDRGNSGGPALDNYGRVVGVVTEMAANTGGLQLVPLVFTYDALSELIEGFIADPDEPNVDCSQPQTTLPPGVDPDAWDSDADTYGDDEALDALWDLCGAGDMEACDDLWWVSPPGSEYEEFADTCGRRNDPGFWCSEQSQ